MLAPITIACLPRCAMAPAPSSRDSSVRHDTHVTRLTFNVDVQPAADPKRAECRFDRPRLILELDAQALVGLRHPADLVEEIHVPGAAADTPMRPISCCIRTASRIAASSTRRSSSV